MELALCTTDYIRRNILPVVIFQAGNAHKQGAVLVGTDYMAGPFVVEVFVISFLVIRFVKRQKKIDYVEVYVVCLYLFLNLLLKRVSDINLKIETMKSNLSYK